MARQRRVHLLIYGRVQGVCFRAATCQQVETLGVTGWVRNCHDGSVEVVAEGEEEALSEMIRWCHKGPPAAMVTRLKVTWEEYVGEFSFFTIKW